jgi:uncharacterized protein YcbK (DUF882 family)
MEITRRKFITRMALVTCGVAGSGLTGVSSFASTLNDRSLAFRSLHTGEKARVTYWSRGDYVPNALHEVDYLLRDWRTGDVYPIDTALLDLLFALRVKLGTTAPYRIISGYRCPSTNAMLAKRSSGVAKKSLHMAGMALDTCLRDCDLTTLRDAALSLKRGGVGYYPKSNFVHIDTGRVRRW